jgi:hypothetical protein
MRESTVLRKQETLAIWGGGKQTYGSAISLSVSLIIRLGRAMSALK